MNEITKETSKKIAEIYYFNYEGYFGFYKSYRNFWLNNLVYVNLSIPCRNVTCVNATPTIKTVSKESTKAIQDFVAAKLCDLTPIKQPSSKGYDILEYFLIEYMDDTKEYYQFDNEFLQIFDMCEFISDGGDIISTPYLVYESIDYAKKIKILDCIHSVIQNKTFRDIINYISCDCILEENYGKYNRIRGKREIEQEIKRRIGFMGVKAKKTYINSSLVGSYNEDGESIVEIKFSVIPHYGSGATYLLSTEFNEVNEITKLKFTLFDKEYKKTKALYGDGLARAKQAIYNDFKSF